jgi:sec-independent protein translocase protein TatA
MERSMGIGWQQLLILAFIVLLLFGSAKLPTLMRDMGRSLNEFKRGMKDANKVEDDSQ